jgi:hypothetical protein
MPIRTVRTVFWALSASVVVLAIAVAAFAGLEPSDAPPLTAAVLLLAVLWLAHEWRQLWNQERRGRGL